MLQDGVFSIPIRAVLPKHQIIVPQHINFHMCATHDTVQLSFTIENTRLVIFHYVLVNNSTCVCAYNAKIIFIPTCFLLKQFKTWSEINEILYDH